MTPLGCRSFLNKKRTNEYRCLLQFRNGEVTHSLLLLSVLWVADSHL